MKMNLSRRKIPAHRKIIGLVGLFVFLSNQINPKPELNLREDNIWDKHSLHQTVDLIYIQK